LHRGFTRKLTYATTVCMLLAACTIIHAQTHNTLELSNSKANVATTHHMLHRLAHKDWIFVAAALQYCGENRIEVAVPRITQILNDTAQSAWLRGRTLVAIMRINSPQAFNTISRFAKDKNPVLRAAVVESLALSKNPNERQLIKQLLQDPNQQVRFQALAIHAQHAGSSAWPDVDAATKSLPDDATSNTKRLAIRSLAYAATPDSIDRIDEWIVQNMPPAIAIQAMRNISNPKLASLLLRIASRTNPEGRDFGAVLTILKQMPRTKIIAAMKTAIQTNNASLIRVAARINTKIVSAPELGDLFHQAALSTDDATTIQAVFSTLGDRRMEPGRFSDLFQKHLKHSAADIRQQAIRCLAHCPDINLYDALKPAINDKEESVVSVVLTTLLSTSTDDAPRGQLVAYLQHPLENDTPPSYANQKTVRVLALKLLAKAGDETDFVPALALLSDRLRSTNPLLRQSAALALGSIAPEQAKPQIAASQGYLTQWNVIGTFLNDQTNTSFNKPFPPETEINFDKKYTAKYVWTLEGHRRDKKGAIEREIGWVKAAVDLTDGKLEIPPLVPPPASLAVGYAITDFKVTVAKEVILDIDGDDAFRVWLNDAKISEKVGQYQRRQPSVAEHKGIKVKLKAGHNRLFIKTSNIDHEWWVRVRMTDASGRPVEVNAQ
jgi:HEAT repeat protein